MPNPPRPASIVCPHCGVHARRTWLGQIWGKPEQGFVNTNLLKLSASVCDACGMYSLWYDGKLVHPDTSSAPRPSEGMPEEVLADFNEARMVFDASPRAAAALLRLSIQKLCVHLGCPGRDLNSDIATLVAKGLPGHVQMALDSVRVIGNNSVHPGEMNVRDDPEVAKSLFDYVNWIVDAMILRPRRIAEGYSKLPGGAREAVARRDG